MDPNEALAQIRAAQATLAAVIEDAQTWEADAPHALGTDGAAAVESLVEHVEALDEWLTRGGFLPSAWQPAAAGVLSETVARIEAITPRETYRGNERRAYWQGVRDANTVVTGHRDALQRGGTA